MYFQSAGGSERFIFYEGTAIQEPLVTGKFIEEDLVLFNADAAASGRVVVVVNDGSARHAMVVENVPGYTGTMKGKTTVKKADLLKADGDEKKLLDACRAQWESFGLTAEESRAVVDAWKPDLLNHPGFMVIARMPAGAYEKMFPLTVTPKPDEVVRAGVVFDTLPGENERLSWLPELKKTMAKWAVELNDEDFKVRQRAAGNFAKLDDMAKPYLEDLLKSAEPEVRHRAEMLIKGLAPEKVVITGHGVGLRPVQPVGVMQPARVNP
jgi:hypothetical protein